VLLSYSVSYPAHPKSIPKEWHRSTSPTACSFKWPITSEGRKETRKRLGFPMLQQQSRITNPKPLNLARNHLVTEGPVSIAYSCLGSMRELPLLAHQRGRWSLSHLTDCNHSSPNTHLKGEVKIPKHENKAIRGHVHNRGHNYSYRSGDSAECVHLNPTQNGTRPVYGRLSPSYRANSR
jgi:hypothetical protein